MPTTAGSTLVPHASRSPTTTIPSTWASARCASSTRTASRPGQGFGTHSHRDMEIISYVLEGALEHKDSMGNGSVIRPGDVQRMTAGTGVTHSEFNASRDEPVHFLQIWIAARRRTGVKPGYEQKAFPEEERTGKLRLVASPDGRDGSVTIQQDVELYAGAARDRRGPAATRWRAGRHAWVHVARGQIEIGGEQLEAGDAAAVSDARGLELERRATRRSAAVRPRVTRLHLVDGTYELFRAHYAPRPDHRAPGGWDAKATVGVVALAAGAAERRRRGGDPHRGGVRQPDSVVPQRSVPRLQERRRRGARAARAVRQRRGGRPRAGRRGLVDARARGRRRRWRAGARLFARPGRPGAHHDARQGPGAVPARRPRRADRPAPAQADRRGDLPRDARLRSAPACRTSWR